VGAETVRIGAVSSVPPKPATASTQLHNSNLPLPREQCWAPSGGNPQRSFGRQAPARTQPPAGASICRDEERQGHRGSLGLSQAIRAGRPEEVIGARVLISSESSEHDSRRWAQGPHKRPVATQISAASPHEPGRAEIALSSGHSVGNGPAMKPHGTSIQAHADGAEQVGPGLQAPVR
jgi:hypothetical protein